MNDIAEKIYRESFIAKTDGKVTISVRFEFGDKKSDGTEASIELPFKEGEELSPAVLMDLLVRKEGIVRDFLTMIARTIAYNL